MTRGNRVLCTRYITRVYNFCVWLVILFTSTYLPVDYKSFLCVSSFDRACHCDKNTLVWLIVIDRMILTVDRILQRVVRG
jgi:hypothetical protein